MKVCDCCVISWDKREVELTSMACSLHTYWQLLLIDPVQRPHQLTEVSRENRNQIKLVQNEWLGDARLQNVCATCVTCNSFNSNKNAQLKIGMCVNHSLWMNYFLSNGWTGLWVRVVLQKTESSYFLIALSRLIQKLKCTWCLIRYRSQNILRQGFISIRSKTAVVTSVSHHKLLNRFSGDFSKEWRPLCVCSVVSYDINQNLIQINWMEQILWGFLERMKALFSP